MLGIIGVSSYLVIGIVCACLCYNLAGYKGYTGYAATGFFFGILGLIYVGFLPDKNLLQALSQLSAPAEPKPQTQAQLEPATGKPKQPISTVSSKEPMICPSCGASYTRSGSHCLHCGSALIPAEQADMYIKCPNCDTLQRSDRKRCLHCGTELIPAPSSETNQQDTSTPAHQVASEPCAIDRSALMILCPKCNTPQKSDRKCCYHCGIKFVDMQ